LYAPPISVSIAHYLKFRKYFETAGEPGGKGDVDNQKTGESGGGGCRAVAGFATNNKNFNATIGRVARSIIVIGTYVEAEGDLVQHSWVIGSKLARSALDKGTTLVRRVLAVAEGVEPPC
jgi:hypothetical protein